MPLRWALFIICPAQPLAECAARLQREPGVLNLQLCDAMTRPQQVRYLFTTHSPPSPEHQGQRHGLTRRYARSDPAWTNSSRCAPPTCPTFACSHHENPAVCCRDGNRELLCRVRHRAPSSVRRVVLCRLTRLVCFTLSFVLSLVTCRYVLSGWSLHRGETTRPSGTKRQRLDTT